MNIVIMIMGPTASGKTDLALDLYDNKNIQIISVDSALIYKDMDIGTAKPDKKTLLKYPHNLLDIISPEQEYSVKNFIQDSLSCIKDAINNNKIPVLVGGTSFYFNALELGISDLPNSNNDSREYTTNLIQELGTVKAHQKLAKIDINIANKIHPNDSQRISRALEVYYLTGKTLSSLQGNKINYLADYNVKKFALMPEREILHQRIVQRFDLMLKLGFIDEVKNLQQKYKLNLSKPSMRCVGYRQVWQYLAGEYDFATMREKSIVATRQLSKRQKTWLRSMKNVNFITSSNEIFQVF